MAHYDQDNELRCGPGLVGLPTSVVLPPECDLG